MTDEENNKRTDLFGDSSAKPLYGSDESVPTGKPLFDSEFSDPGDAAFVKPLFGDSEEDDEPLSLDDFQEFDNIPADDISDVSGDAAPEVPADEVVPAAEQSLDGFVSGVVAAETSAAADADAVADANPFAAADAAAPADADTDPFGAPPAAQETKPPFSEDMFGMEDSLPEPTFTIPASKVALSGDLEAMSLGALMAYARETVGYTPENVYEGTKINEKFLFAIESDQFDKLPSGAFPGAYVRALCSFYHLENDVCEVAQKKAAAYCTACRPPDDVYDRLPEHAVINREEQEKFRRLLLVAGSILLAIIVLIIIIVSVSVSDSSDAADKPVASPVKMEDLEKLSPPPSPITPTELDVPK